MKLKNCSKCDRSLPADTEHFIKNKSCAGGIAGVCKDCNNSYVTDWKRKNSKRLAQHRREVRAIKAALPDRNPIITSAENLICGVRARTKKHNIPSSKELLSKEYIMDWLKRQPFCECCNMPFWFGRKNKIGPNARSPSFDQIIPGRGYTLENVALICWRCNRIKCNCSADELRSVAKWIDGKIEKFSAPLEEAA